MISKFKRKNIDKPKRPPIPKNTDESPTSEQLPAVDDKELGIGECLHMDFGFVRGSDWSSKDNDNKLVTSVDGYQSYLLIID